MVRIPVPPLSATVPPATDASGCTITPYQDGPYLLRGDFQVTDQEGSEIDVGRRTVALCRCGKSRIRPFCDGTHRAIGFKAPSAVEGERGLATRPRMRESRPPVGGASRRASGDRAPEGSGLRCPDDLVGLLRESLRDIEWAHESISQELEGPCPAGDQGAMRVAEPLVGAARTLIEWRAAGTRVDPLPEPRDPVVGIAALVELTTLSTRKAEMLALQWSDAAIRSAAALLQDADLVMRRRTIDGLDREHGDIGQAV